MRRLALRGAPKVSIGRGYDCGVDHVPEATLVRAISKLPQARMRVDREPNGDMSARRSATLLNGA